jgi:hypothetical protein
MTVDLDRHVLTSRGGVRRGERDFETFSLVHQPSAIWSPNRKRPGDRLIAIERGRSLRCNLE